MPTPLEWGALVKKHHIQGLRYANSILHTRVRETAEAAKDIVQDAWMTAWLKATNLDHARALFFASVRLRALDMVRRASTRDFWALDESSPLVRTVSLGWGAQAHPGLLRAVGCMTCEGFDTWFLADVLGFPDKAIQEELQITRVQEQNRLYRARKALNE